MHGSQVGMVLASPFNSQSWHRIDNSQVYKLNDLIHKSTLQTNAIGGKSKMEPAHPQWKLTCDYDMNDISRSTKHFPAVRRSQTAFQLIFVFV